LNVGLYEGNLREREPSWSVSTVGMHNLCHTFDNFVSFSLACDRLLFVYIT
jgi:hypothetical protein